MDIKLKITRGQEQELYLTAKTMNELVGKIIEWQDYDNYVETIKQFKKKPTEEKLKKEKESGWYYIKQQIDLVKLVLSKRCIRNGVPFFIIFTYYKKPF